jgi:formylglycine-generating enzyme required for sulfatase activity
LPSSDDKRETLAKRQANAAVALLKINQPVKVWPLFKHSDDPRVRSHLIHRLSPLGADAQAIIRRLDQEPEISIRRALLLSLGQYGEKDFTLEDRKALLPKLREMYQKESDPGLHAAAEWVSRTWKEEGWLKQVNEKWAKDGERREKKIAEIKELVRKDKDKTPPQWYVNMQGQTFVVIPGPVEFRMGSPKTEAERFENETQHKRRISRTFAIAAKSVTLAEYRSLPTGKYEIDERYTRHPNLPVVGVTWYMAAKYCNLLSQEEGIDENQWCYETDAHGAVTKLKTDYLSLTGYRLPTEAEMEYATRAKALTSRYFGETDDLLRNYAWYRENSGDLLQRVGGKKPNDFGLFDTQGNCFTWCQDPLGDYLGARDDEVVEDKELPKDKLAIIGTHLRVLRGCSYFNAASNLRSSQRGGEPPTNGGDFFGVRPARTIKP